MQRGALVARRRATRPATPSCRGLDPTCAEVHPPVPCSPPVLHYVGLGDEADGFFAETISAYDGRRIEQAEKCQPEREFLEFHRQEVFRG